MTQSDYSEKENFSIAIHEIQKKGLANILQKSSQRSQTSVRQSSCEKKPRMPKKEKANNFYIKENDQKVGQQGARPLSLCLLTPTKLSPRFTSVKEGLK